jgi:SnoaL-like domain
MATDMQASLAALIDREEIFDLARRERFSRDQRDWTTMRDCFHDEATIRTSWFDGGADNYVAATRQRMERIATGKHWVFPAGLNIVGDRATVESPAMIFDRLQLDGVEVDVQVFCRFFSRVMRRDGKWRLRTFEVLFERDVMRAVNPSEPLPVDWAVLAGYRPSYRFLTYVQESRGSRVNPNLYGDDRRESLLAFYATERQWVATGH